MRLDLNYTVTKFEGVRGAIYALIPDGSNLYRDGANRTYSFLDMMVNNRVWISEVHRDGVANSTIKLGDTIANAQNQLGTVNAISIQGITLNIHTGAWSSPIANVTTHDQIRARAERQVVPEAPQRPTPQVQPQPAPTQNNNVIPANSLQEIEQRIVAANPRPIKLDRVLRRRTETLVEFLRLFFTRFNNDRDTLYADDQGGVQTVMGRRRSLGDIFMICRFYYPNCTINQVLTALYQTLPATINQGFRTSYCFGVIHKRVWYYDGQRTNTVADRGQVDENGRTYRWYANQLGIRETVNA